MHNHTCQTAETAISKASIQLLILDLFDFQTELCVFIVAQ